jgi:excinuclease UvrABC nuclease subunit
MAKRLSIPKPFNEENINKLPNQSGAYVLWRKESRKPYIGMAEAGNLRKRVKQHFTKRDKKYVNRFSVFPTQSTREATMEEARLRNKLNPDQKI